MFSRWIFSVALMFGLTACSEPQQAPAPQPPKAVVDHPTQKTIIDYDEYTGRFAGSETVELRARVDGYLDQILFVDGEYVDQGQLLFIIDPRPFVIAKERAQAQYDFAATDWKRKQRLIKTKAISKQEFDDAKRVHDAAKADLDQALLDLDYTRITAPISGLISRRLLDVGNLVEADDTLLTTIITQDPLDFYFEVSEQNAIKYQSIKDNSHVSITIQGDDHQHHGRLNFMNNAIDDETGTLQMRAQVSNAKGVLKPGMFGRLRLQASEKYQALLVPEKAIGAVFTNRVVYVVDDNNIVTPRPVTLGRLNGDGRVITQGLEKTDRIIIEGLMQARPGNPITPITPEQAAKDQAKEQAEHGQQAKERDAEKQQEREDNAIKDGKE